MTHVSSHTDRVHTAPASLDATDSMVGTRCHAPAQAYRARRVMGSTPLQPTGAPTSTRAVRVARRRDGVAKTTMCAVYMMHEMQLTPYLGPHSAYNANRPVRDADRPVHDADQPARDADRPAHWGCTHCTGNFARCRASSRTRTVFHCGRFALFYPARVLQLIYRPPYA